MGIGLFLDDDATAAHARPAAAGKGAACLAGDIRGVAVVVCSFPSEGAVLCGIVADSNGAGMRESILRISSTLFFLYSAP